VALLDAEGTLGSEQCPGSTAQQQRLTDLKALKKYKDEKNTRPTLDSPSLVPSCSLSHASRHWGCWSCGTCCPRAG